MIDVASFAQDAGKVLDAVGVVAILAGIVLATATALARVLRGGQAQKIYRFYRHNLARSILLGLEFLVAGDIIRSVAGNLSFESVGVLAVIVVIRALLSLQFETEIEGRWPWQRSGQNSRA